MKCQNFANTLQQHCAQYLTLRPTQSLGYGLGVMGTTTAYARQGTAEIVHWPSPVQFGTNVIPSGKVVTIKNPLQNGIQSRTTVYTFFSCSSFQNIQEHVLLGTAFSACYCLFEFLSCLKLAHNYKLNWPKRVTAVYCSLGHCFTPFEGRMYSAIVEQYSVLQKKKIVNPSAVIIRKGNACWRHLCASERVRVCAFVQSVTQLHSVNGTNTATIAIFNTSSTQSSQFDYENREDRLVGKGLGAVSTATTTQFRQKAHE